MTYVHFELLLLFVNKYRMREIRYKERESLETYLEAKRKVIYLWGRRSLFIAYALGLQPSSDQSVKWLLDIREISEQLLRYLVIILLLE